MLRQVIARQVVRDRLQCFMPKKAVSVMLTAEERKTLEALASSRQHMTQPEIGPETKLVFGSMERRQEVARRHYRPEEIMAKLREAEVLLGRGKKMAEVVK